MSPIDDELRRTLAGRAADVPALADPLAAVEDRARGLRSQRRWLAGLGAVVALLCGALVVPLLADNTSPAPVLTATPSQTVSRSQTASASATTASVAPTAATSSPGPTSAPPAATTSGTPAPAGTALAVYYLGDTGTRAVLYREFRRTTETDRVRAAIGLMLAGPLDPQYSTPWKSGVQLRDLDIEGDLATVTFGPDTHVGGVGSAAACLALQQLVYTVTATDNSIKRVRIAVEGHAGPVVAEWAGVGCGDNDELVRQTPSYEALAPVQISTYNEGDAVRSRFFFGGEATVFEATVSWAVVDAAGTEVAAGHATASKGAPERGQWQANVVLPAAKRGDVLELRAWEASAEDGRVTNLDTKQVVVGR